MTGRVRVRRPVAAAIVAALAAAATPQPELQPAGTIELGSFELWRRGISGHAG